MKIIDLSIPIEDGLPSDPPIQIPKIQYCNHTVSYTHLTLPTIA